MKSSRLPPRFLVEEPGYEANVSQYLRDLPAAEEWEESQKREMRCSDPVTTIGSGSQLPEPHVVTG